MVVVIVIVVVVVVLVVTHGDVKIHILIIVDAGEEIVESLKVEEDTTGRVVVISDSEMSWYAGTVFCKNTIFCIVIVEQGISEEVDDTMGVRIWIVVDGNVIVNDGLGIQRIP